MNGDIGSLPEKNAFTHILNYSSFLRFTDDRWRTFEINTRLAHRLYTYGWLDINGTNWMAPSSQTPARTLSKAKLEMGKPPDKHKDWLFRERLFLLQRTLWLFFLFVPSRYRFKGAPFTEPPQQQGKVLFRDSVLQSAGRMVYRITLTRNWLVVYSISHW